jgi:hypothetical protein
MAETIGSGLRETISSPEKTSSGGPLIQFTSFVMEPDRSQPVTMKHRDNNKPLIDPKTVQRQLEF